MFDLLAPNSSTLAWKIPWMEEPGGLQSMGSLRVRHDWATSLSLFTFMHWRRKWQPTPVFLPGESQGRGSLVGLPSMGLHRVGHDWKDLAAAAAANLFLWCSMLLSLLIFYIPLTRMYIPLFGCKRLYTNKVQLVHSIVQVILHSLVYYLLYQLLKNDCQSL